MAWGRGVGVGGVCSDCLAPLWSCLPGPRCPLLVRLPPAWDLVSSLKCSQQHLVPASEPKRARGRDVVPEQMLAHSGYLTSWGHSRHPSG